MSGVCQHLVQLLHRYHACPVRARSNTMPKNQRSNKETKKQPLHTAKEKKAAKREKKQNGGHAPFIAKDL
jgi:hypothetical protein